MKNRMLLIISVVLTLGLLGSLYVNYTNYSKAEQTKKILTNGTYKVSGLSVKEASVQDNYIKMGKNRYYISEGKHGDDLTIVLQNTVNNNTNMYIINKKNKSINFSPVKKGHVTSTAFTLNS